MVYTNTSIWEISWGKKRLLFTSRNLILQSIRLSHSSLPDVKIHDHGDAVMVEWATECGHGTYQQWFGVAQIVNEHIYNDVEHL